MLALLPLAVGAMLLVVAVAGDAAPVEGLATIVLLAPLAWFAGSLFERLSDSMPLHFTNHTLAERIDNLVDMLSRARREIVIVTGSLHHALYNHPRVVAALRKSRARSIRLIHTAAELDPESGGFIRELKRRGVRPVRALDCLIRHAVIVDRRDTKLEELGAPDQAPLKASDYYYNDKSVAESVLGELEALETTPTEFPGQRASLAR